MGTLKGVNTTFQQKYMEFSVLAEMNAVLHCSKAKTVKKNTLIKLEK